MNILVARSCGSISNINNETGEVIIDLPPCRWSFLWKLLKKWQRRAILEIDGLRDLIEVNE